MNATRPLSILSLALVAAAALPAQDLDVYWQANRKSLDVTKISACGEVLLTVDLSTNIPAGQTTAAELRSAHMAPDGTVWVVNFIRPYLTLFDTDGNNLINVPTNGGGNPYSIAFDKAGNAYVSSPGAASAIEVFDKTGTFVRSYAIGGTPLGLTIDSDGNVWAAHRVTAPSRVTKIDVANNSFQDFPFPGGTSTLGGQVVAGFNGILRKSDIFCIGDRSSELVHLDVNGNVLNVVTLDPSVTSVGTLTIDGNNNVWVGDYRGGNIYKYDPAQKQVVATLSSPPSVNGLAMDSRGRLLATSRVSFSGPQPSEVRRYDVVTNTLEQVTAVGLGAGSAASSGFHRALVLDPFGDADGDLEVNFAEIGNSTAPFDSQSTSTHNLLAVGSNALGGSVDVEVQGTAGARAVLAISLGRLATQVCPPGWDGCVRIDPALLFPGLFFYTVPGKLSLNVPNNPAIRGVPVYFQAAYDYGPTQPLSVSNLECLIPY